VGATSPQAFDPDEFVCNSRVSLVLHLGIWFDISASVKSDIKMRRYASEKN